MQARRSRNWMALLRPTDRAPRFRDAGESGPPGAWRRGWGAIPGAGRFGLPAAPGRQGLPKGFPGRAALPATRGLRGRERGCLLGDRRDLLRVPLAAQARLGAEAGEARAAPGRQARSSAACGSSRRPRPGRGEPSARRRPGRVPRPGSHGCDFRGLAKEAKDGGRAERSPWAGEPTGGAGYAAWRGSAGSGRVQAMAAGLLELRLCRAIRLTLFLTQGGCVSHAASWANREALPACDTYLTA